MRPRRATYSGLSAAQPAKFSKSLSLGTQRQPSPDRHHRRNRVASRRHRRLSSRGTRLLAGRPSCWQSRRRSTWPAGGNLVKGPTPRSFRTGAAGNARRRNRASTSSLAQKAVHGWAISRDRALGAALLAGPWSLRRSARWSWPCCGAATSASCYPLVEVVGNNQSLGQWVDEAIADAQRTIAKHGRPKRSSAAKLAAGRAPTSRGPSSANWPRPPSRREAARSDLDRYPLAQALDRRLPARRSVSHAGRDRGAAAGRHDRQGRVPDAELVPGRSAGAAGDVRLAQAVLSPHAADGPGHVSTKAARATCCPASPTTWTTWPAASRRCSAARSASR